MSFGLCNALASFQRCMMSIFSYMIEEIIEVFMDDFSIYESFYMIEEIMEEIIEEIMLI